MTNGQDKPAGPQEPRRRGDGEVTDHPVATPEPWPDWLEGLSTEAKVSEILTAYEAQVEGDADEPCRLTHAESCNCLLRLLGEVRIEAETRAARATERALEAEHALIVKRHNLRERIDAALGESLDHCPRCKVCDAQLDAIMAALAAEPESRSGQGGEGDHAEAVRIAQENAGPGVRVFWHAGGLCYHPERAPQGGNPAAEVPSEPVMDLLETAWAVIAGAGWNDPESSGYQLSPRLVNWELAAETWRRRYQVLVAEYAAAKAGNSEPTGGEPEDAEHAVAYWSGRWAETANRCADAVGIIHDLCQHANPIAVDDDGFVAAGYTVTVGAVHRAFAWLQGASRLQGDGQPERVMTWAEYEKWLAAHWPGKFAKAGPDREVPEAHRPVPLLPDGTYVEVQIKGFQRCEGYLTAGMWHGERYGFLADGDGAFVAAFPPVAGSVHMITAVPEPGSEPEQPDPWAPPGELESMRAEVTASRRLLTAQHLKISALSEWAAEFLEGDKALAEVRAILERDFTPEADEQEPPF